MSLICIMMSSIFHNIILSQDFLKVILHFSISIITLYFSSRLLGLKKWVSIFTSSIIFTFINLLITSIFEINFWLKLILFLIILKFTYNISWSRSLFLLLILCFLSNIIRLIIPILPCPI